jgi:hypothetical protein
LKPLASSSKKHGAWMAFRWDFDSDIFTNFLVELYSVEGKDSDEAGVSSESANLVE